MWSWFLKIIGVSPDVLTHLERAELVWQRPAILWLGLLLIGPAGYFIYRRQLVNLPTVASKWRNILTATRVTTLLILIAILAGPYLRIDHKFERKPIVAVLFDRSQSMNLPAGPFETDDESLEAATGLGHDPTQPIDESAKKTIDEKSRAELAHALFLSAREDWLKQLDDQFEVRFYSVARETEPLADPFSEQGNTTTIAAEGPATHIGTAVNHVLEEAAGQAVAAMVLFSDGQNTGGFSPSESIASANRAKTPLFPVLVGSRKRLQDLSIVDVYTSGQVSVGDTVRVAVTIESQGFDGRPITVELREGEKTLDAKELTLSSSEQQQLELIFVATEPGLRYLTVVVPSFPEEPEALRTNNTDVAIVRVSEDKLKLLIVEGLPRWDFRFLKNAVKRDHGLAGATSDEVDILLEAEWRRLSTEEQQTKLEQVVESLADYHTVVLGDVSPELLKESWRPLLIESVQNQGLGLIVAAGPNFMPQAFDSSFQELLPVQLRPKTQGTEAPAYKPFRVEVSPPGLIHDAMRLYDDPARNQFVWTRMPPFYWSAAAERASPAATVLAWNPTVENRFGKMPLIAYHYAGEGKVAFVGTDSTWTWRQNVGDRYFYRFWGQMIRFVARKETSGKKIDSLEVRPLRAQPGEKAEIELFAYNTDNSPRSDASLEITAVGPNGNETVELLPDVAHEGRYVGQYAPKQIGEHRLLYQPASTKKPVEAKLRVIPSAVELRDPNVNRPFLDNLAQATGGKLLKMNELHDMPELLTGKPQLVEIHREATIWDNWLTLLLLVIVYSIDVGIRRLMGLS
ncbi:MAG: hypothetical protein O2955_15055 [Planctomycetota bacterium]|nr:hypothetical protein [Planctomycetota bacterium]MDA1213833.1 hypothetical protein [Planctomycetota bacterium]